jgi:hypothetical protein
MGRKLYLLILCVFALALDVTAQGQVTKCQLKERSLNRYEKAGPYTVLPTAENAASVEAEMRDFLWQHWHKRQLGYLSATFYSKEGDATTSSYFVEPDKFGNWHIEVVIESTRLVRSGIRGNQSSKNKTRKTCYAAFSIERVEVRDKVGQSSLIIPEEDNRSPQSYTLRLKDRNGTVLTEI